MSSKLSNIGVPAEAFFGDVRKMGGSWVIDQRGTFGVVAAYETNGNQAWVVSFDGDVPFTVLLARSQVRALNLAVGGMELVAGSLTPRAVDDALALGTLVFGEQGACIVVQEPRDNGTVERRLFNLVTKQFDDLNGQARLSAKYWSLRGIRDNKVVLEYDVEAVDEVPLEPRDPPQFRNPLVR